MVKLTPRTEVTLLIYIILRQSKSSLWVSQSLSLSVSLANLLNHSLTFSSVCAVCVTVITQSMYVLLFVVTVWLFLSQSESQFHCSDLLAKHSLDSQQSSISGWYSPTGLLAIQVLWQVIGLELLSSVHPGWTRLGNARSSLVLFTWVTSKV